MFKRKSFFLKRRGYTEHCLQQEMLISIRQKQTSRIDAARSRLPRDSNGFSFK